MSETWHEVSRFTTNGKASMTSWLETTTSEFTGFTVP